MLLLHMRNRREWGTDEGKLGDVAVALLKEGADHTLKTNEDMVALDLAPDKDVGPPV